MDIMMKCFIFWKKVLMVFFYMLDWKGYLFKGMCLWACYPVHHLYADTRHGGVHKMWNMFLLLKQEFRSSSCCLCSCCCWQLFKQVQMEFLWSRCTSHFFEPPWINDQGREVQTTFYDRWDWASSLQSKEGFTILSALVHLNQLMNRLNLYYICNYAIPEPISHLGC